MAKKKNIHDTFFKSMMAERDIAIDFMNQFLPNSLLEIIDTNTLQAEKDSYISTELKEYFSDALFTLQLKGKEKTCKVAVLLEHKSRKDDLTTFQVLMYLASGYLAQAKSKQELIPIIPVIYYHGKEKWTLKPLEEYFNDIPQIKQFLPNFDMIYIDLVRMSDEALMNLTNSLLSAALVTQKYSKTPKELEQQITKIINTLIEGSERNFFQSIFVYLLYSVDFSESKLISYIENVPEQIKDKIMSTYDQILTRGKSEGEQIGVLKGKHEEKIETVITGYQNDITIEVLAIITKLSIEEVKEIIKKHKTK